MSDTLKMTVPGRPEYVGTVRLTLSSLAMQAGFDVDAIDDIKVAASEACTNIVIHSHTDDEFEYNVTCEISPGKLVVTVKDDGNGYDVNEYKEPNTDEINESGLGIFIIKALMDEVEIKSERGVGTYIRMTKLAHTEELG